MALALALSLLGTQAAKSADSGDKIEEIVVTAQRRSENLQSVPISVTAVTGRTLEALGVSDTTTLSQVVPGLDISRQSAAGTPFLRGIGSSNSSPGDESPIAMYVDGAYIASTAGNLFGLNNIERIEVLKGPQGTLFGRNATGGVIQIITKDPVQAPSADLSVGYGNFETIESNFYGTTGIAANLAADLAVYQRNQLAGWGHYLPAPLAGEDAFTSRELALRTKWLWTALDNTRVTFSADYDRDKDSGGSSFHVPPGVKTVDGSTFPGYYNLNLNTDSYSDVTRKGSTLTVDDDLGWSRVKSITAWRNVLVANPFDVDFSPSPIFAVDLHQKSDTWTQEFQLLSKENSRISWIAGIYMFYDDAQYFPLHEYGAALGPIQYVDIFSEQKSNSYAGYGQATIPIGFDTRVTLGGRYTWDKRHLTGHEDSLIGILIPEENKSANFDKFTYRVALDHDFAQDIMAYGVLSTGFKSGVYNTILNGAGDALVRPETLDAYELGLKTAFLDRTIRVNTSAFYYKYKDIQVQAVQSNISELLNAAAAHVKGGEIEIEATPVTRLRLLTGLSYLDAKYTDFPGAQFTIPNPAGGNSAVTRNAAGNIMPHSPKWTVHTGGLYSIPTPSGDYAMSADLAYHDAYFWEASNRLQEPVHFLLSASLGWTAPSKAWGIKLWGKNLLDQEVSNYTESTALSDGVSPAAPRTYGIALNLHFE
jgi:iron complex outermembrane receptor protein